MLTRISIPADEPIDLAEVKAALAVIGNADDALLSRLISAATAAFDGPEGKIGRCLVSQSWRLDLPAYPVGNIRLPMPPVSAVSAISYTDRAGVTGALDPSAYSVAGLGSTDHCIIAPVTRWPTASAVSVTFVAGFGTADKVPEDIRDAILAVVGSRYAWREAQVLAQGSIDDNPEVADVVERWRIRGFG